MSRKQEEINPVSGSRLKSLLAAQCMTQKELASRLNYTEQHISSIVKGKRRLTLETAQAIVKLFPLNYRAEWLMGYDDYSTNCEYGMKQIDDKFKRYQVMEDFIDMVVKSLGYEIKLEEEQFFVLKDGKNICNCPNTKYKSLGNEIWRYARYLAKDVITDAISVSQKEVGQNTSEENEGDNNG